MLPPKGIKFSQCKKFAAIAEKDGGKDKVGIYYATDEWQLLNRLDVDTFDLQDIFWAMDDSHLVIQDNPLEPRILCYNVSLGTLTHKYDLEVAGRASALAVRNLFFSPDSKFFAAGLYDTEIHIYRPSFEKSEKMASLQHTQRIDLNQKSKKKVYVYQEEVTKATKNNINVSHQYVCFQSTPDDQQKQEIVRIPQIPKKEIEGFKNSAYEKVGLDGPPVGVNKMQWSYTSHYLAT